MMEEIRQSSSRAMLVLCHAALIPSFGAHVLVAFSDAHKKHPSLFPKETDLMSMCNISASSMAPAPEGAHVSLLEGVTSLPPMATPYP